MKINIGCLALVAALAPAAEAWSLYANGKQIVKGSESERTCDKLRLKKGQKVSWYEAFFQNCTFTLYEDTKCSDWAGSTDKEWKNHKLSQNVGSYSVKCFID